MILFISMCFCIVVQNLRIALEFDRLWILLQIVEVGLNRLSGRIQHVLSTTYLVPLISSLLAGLLRLSHTLISDPLVSSQRIGHAILPAHLQTDRDTSTIFHGLRGSLDTCR